MWILQSTDPEVPLTFRLLPGDVRTIGRAAGAQFVVDRPLVSRVHCRLTLDDSRLRVEDLGSTNGTFVNGTPVNGAAPLEPGDTLRVGRVEFSVERQQPEGD